MFEKWKALLKSGRGTYVLIGIGVLSAAVIVLWPGEKTEQQVQNAAAIETQTDQAEILSERIAKMVSAITGEPDPHVTVTLRSSGETVYATEDRRSEKNAQEYSGEELNKTQTDDDTETTYIIVKAADGSQQPLIVTQTEPEVQGVVIVSRMGNDVQIREKITQAVKTALDLSSTQVCVTGYAEYT